MGRRTGAEELTNRVRELRAKAGLSQGELAKRAGITRQAVSAIETSNYVPNTVVALRLSRALGCTVDDIFALGDISLQLRARLGSETGEWNQLSKLEPDSGERGIAPQTSMGKSHDTGFRVTLARVGEEFIASELSGPERFAAADGIGRFIEQEADQIDVELLIDPDVPEHSVLLLGCDPSLGLLADHVHRTSGDTRVLWRHAGSVAALRALRAGEAHIAGTHLWDPETGESNLPVIRRELAGMPVTVIAASQWQQGLMIPRGNPKRIRFVSDLVRPDVSIVNREAGSGSRVLLDHHLSRAGVDPAMVSGYDRLRGSHGDVAAAVRDGLADAGPGILATARAYGLDFIPLQEERYDLVIPVRFIDERPVRAVLDTLTGRGYRQEIETLGGYNAKVTGTTIAEVAS